MKFHVVKFAVVCCALTGSICLAVEEPNDIVGSSYSTFGTFEDHQPCGWRTVLDRKSTDETDERLIVKLDSCQVFDYTVETVQQGSPTPVSFDLKPDDIFIEWDENAGDELRMDFEFSGSYVQEEPDYVQVSSTNNDIIHWTVYRVTNGGTLTITGTGYNEHDAFHLTRNIMEFWKDDGIEEPNCVSENDEIVYQICFDNAFGDVLQEAFVVDWLPDEVDYPAGADHYVFDGNSIQFVEGDPGYTPRPEHCYVWDLEQIDPNTSDCLELSVVVNDTAVPGEYLHNVAELYGLVWVPDPNDPNDLIPQTQLVARAYVDTFVCCDGEVTMLYVDQNAAGTETGLNWGNAFTDLQDALARALDTTCGQVDTILVAQGNYVPGESENDIFALSENLSLYGGFPTGGCDFIDRNPKQYKTVLTGFIDPNTRADTVVTMADETLLDGFTITKSSQDGQGIFASNADFYIEQCKIEENFGYGAYTEDSNATFQWCYVTDNKRDGIRHSGSGYVLTLENCWIQRSQRYGIVCTNSTPTVRNSIITESDLANEGRAGIFMGNPAGQPVLQNVTCAHNKTFGIWQAGGALPSLQNCIVYHNGGPALAGFSADDAASYCCIEDCNSVNNNINLDPEFVYFDPNNVRIKMDSPCHDSGLTLQENYVQVDMDNRTRVLGTAVDRGAYEIECEDTSNSFDANHDGLVNLYEFSAFSRAWLSRDPNDPSLPSDPNLIDPNDFTNWNPACDLNEDYTVSLPDIVMFIDEAPWLWRACWLTDDSLFEMLVLSGGESMLMAMPLESLSAESGFAVPVELEAENPYADMSTAEVVSLVQGVYGVLEYVNTAITEDNENTENLLEIKDFLEDVLADIRASRQ